MRVGELEITVVDERLALLLRIGRLRLKLFHYTPRSGLDGEEV
jgi:hypothetical protein